MAKTAKPSILDVFADATDDDLVTIDERIASLSGDIKKLQDEITALGIMRKTISVKLHGKPERKKPVRKAKTATAPPASDKSATDDDADRSKIYDWLADQKGPCKPGVIGAALNIHHLRVNSLCKHAWFDESIAGFSIA